MLGRKNYTQEELDQAKKAIAQQLAAYKKLVKAVDGATSDLLNDGVLRANKVIKYVPGQSVAKLEIGDRIMLTAAQFERLSKAFFGEIEARFL